MKTIPAILTMLLLTATALAADFQPVACEGTYPHHLQGVCTDDKDSIFWCFTTKLVKTDLTGKIVKQVNVANRSTGSHPFGRIRYLDLPSRKPSPGPSSG